MSKQQLQLLVAMFSVAGGPYEIIAKGTDRSELLIELACAADQWNCRTYGYVREATKNEQKQT